MTPKFKLAVFDMDGTLLKRRTIFVFADKKGFMDGLLKIVNSNRKSYEKSIEIAKLLKGMDSRELLQIFRNIPLQEHVEDVIRELKKKSIRTAIATNSYQFIADDLKERLGIDYAFANNLIIDEDIVTGELIIDNKELRQQFNGCKIHSICKECILDDLCKELGITQGEVIAVGDSAIDSCMLEKAGLGIAFNAPEEVQKHADISISDMNIILDYI
jgi:phosphoserine phosphatase